MTEAPFPSLPRTFYVACPLRELRPLFLTCLITFILIALILPPHLRWGLIPLAGVMAVPLIAASVFVFHTHLDVSEDEIVFHAPGYRVRSAWANLLGCARRRVQTRRLEVLLLVRPGIEPWTRGTQKQNYIPVSWFEKNHWRKGDLGRIIEHYAPHAFYRLLP